MKIGFVLPISESDATRQTPPYAEIRDLALGAEDAGFDSVWLYDHLLYRFGDPPTTRGVWEIWTLLSALAEATERVELGALVLCVPFRNPALLAKMADTLEEVSGGRFILGLGAGWHKPEFDAFGFPFDHKVDRFEEALAIILPLMREGKVDFAGTHYRAAGCELRPRGSRSGGPPILIGSSGPRMLRLTAQHADQWNTCWLGQPAALAPRQRDLEAACTEVGRDPSTLEVTVGVTVAYPDLNPARPGEPPDPAKALFGTPEDIAAGLKGYADLGVSHVMCACSPTNAATLALLTEALQAYQALEDGPDRPRRRDLPA